MNKYTKLLYDGIIVIIGNMILALGYVAFAIPANLIVGGATGLAIIFSHFINVDYATIVFIINMIMLLIGYFVLGKKFAMGTILSSFVFPLCLSAFESIPHIQNITNDMLLSCIYAGILIGLGVGIVFRLGYSTGGMDVPPLIINKKTGISIAPIMNICDTTILLGQVFFTNFEGILYGIITVIISNYVLDKVVVMGERNIQVFVISKKHEEIAEAIFSRIDRGCTFVNVTTGYLHDNQRAVLCILNRRENIKLHDIVLDIDPTAFIIANEVHSVKGRGFTLPDINIEKSHE